MGQCLVQIEDKMGNNREEVRSNLQEDLRQSFEVRIDVHIVPQGSIPRFDYKSKRFVDKRGEHWLPSPGL